MPEKAAYLYIADGFADWEPAHAVAELRRHGHYRVETVSLTGSPVESMGGLHVLPSMRLAEVQPSDAAIMILPGGDFWLNSPIDPVLESTMRLFDTQNIPIAAICAATTAIARMGILHGRRHTSNSLEFLQKELPTYSEASNYVDQPAVRDRRLITASGLGDVEFAREIFEELGVMSMADRAQWAEIFRSARLPGGLS